MGHEIADPLVRVINVLDVRAVGIAGPPGGGKSTLARATAERLDDATLVLSMDDFYLSKADRAARGIPWRGPPGSHDLDALIDVLDGVRAQRVPIALARFSSEIDDRIEHVMLNGVPQRVIVEGWVLGHRSDGYDRILERLDLLVFFDVPVELARARRYEREAALRRSGGGFSATDMDRFWTQVLEPGLDRWVREARATADLRIEVDASGELVAVHASRADVREALEGSG